jgi:hypothetical protein
MTASEIIREIASLSPEERAKVVRFAYELDAERNLTGEELSLLARRMIDAVDPAEALVVREGIVRGFHGDRGPSE